ncbi:MAG: DNA primase [Lentisphaeria bacterium]
MAGIPDRIIEEVRDRSDIVTVIEGYTPVKRRGNRHWACCPFHNEKTPSFAISPEKQTFYCFGCKKSGNVFHFIQEKENVDFVGAVRLLAQRAGIVIPEDGEAGPGGTPRKTRDRLFDLMTAVAAWYQQQLRESAAGTPGREYLAKRNIPDEVVRQFGLGYAPGGWDGMTRWGAKHGYDEAILLEAGLLVPREGGGTYDRFRDRLVFPIWDEMGRVVGFSARTLEAKPEGAKYINTPETPVFHKGRLLYALHFARTSFKEHGALICEGQFDVIACHRAGVTQAVAPQGTAFTETHAALLKRSSEVVTFAFDADTAGEKAALRSIAVALAVGLSARVVALPPGDDPDSLFRRGGPEALAAVMRQARDALQYVLDKARSQHDPQSAEGRTLIAEAVLAIIGEMPHPVGRAAAVQWLAGETALPEDALFASLARRKNSPARRPPASSAQEPAGAGGGPAAAVADTGQAPAPRRDGGAQAAAILGGPSLAGSDPALAVERMLLDLTLHYETLAVELAALLPPERIGGTPVGRALNLVLAHAGQGEWALAAHDLSADQDLAAHPDVARVLMDGDFTPPAADHPEAVRAAARARRAMKDCLSRLDLVMLERELTAKNRELAGEADRGRAAALAGEVASLVRRRHELRAAAHTH